MNPQSAYVYVYVIRDSLTNSHLLLLIFAIVSCNVEIALGERRFYVYNENETPHHMKKILLCVLYYYNLDLHLHSNKPTGQKVII